MSETTLDWRLRQILAELKEGYRLNVWIDYVLHCNERNRAAPSVDTIMRECGIKGRVTVTDAKAWLVSHQALIPVPYNLRVGSWEKGLGRRASLMQITGQLVLDGRIYPMLYSNLLIGESIAGMALGAGYLDTPNSSLTELSASESSLTEPKVNTILKVNTSSKDNAILKTDEPSSPSPTDEEIYQSPIIRLWYQVRDLKARPDEAKQHMPKAERRILYELVGNDPARLEYFRICLDIWIGLGYRFHNYSGQRDFFTQWERAGFSPDYWARQRGANRGAATLPSDHVSTPMDQTEAEIIKRLGGA